MSEAIAFFAGLITMGFVWFWTDYLDSGSAYNRGYRDALHDEIEIEIEMRKRRKEKEQT